MRFSCKDVGETRGLTGEKRQQQETTAFEHLAIVGGFLFVIIHGAGPAERG
jgi:uncharacterized membrane protein YphA (DoxX/SURF4 family)